MDSDWSEEISRLSSYVTGLGPLAPCGSFLSSSGPSQHFAGPFGGLQPTSRTQVANITTQLSAAANPTHATQNIAGAQLAAVTMTLSTFSSGKRSSLGGASCSTKVKGTWGMGSMHGEREVCYRLRVPGFPVVPFSLPVTQLIPSVLT